MRMRVYIQAAAVLIPASTAALADYEPAPHKPLAELIIDGEARSTDLAPFDPGRLRALDPAFLRSP